MANPNVNITNPIPTTLNDLIVELKFLGKIERGMKVNMNNMTFVDSASWLEAIRRGLNGEGRKSLLMHINTIVDSAIESISEYHGTEFCKIIVNALAEARLGIQALSNTYQDDPFTVSKMDVIIANIDLQLNKNKDLLEGHNKGVRGAAVVPAKVAGP